MRPRGHLTDAWTDCRDWLSQTRIVALTDHYPHITFVSWLLIGQIPLQHQIVIDPADGNNLSVPLYQQAGNNLAAH